jgi:arsenite methyltransferase
LGQKNRNERPRRFDDQTMPILKLGNEMESHDLASDVWSEWLLHHRHADDPAYAQVVQAAVEGYADRVLEGAQLAAGMTLVDVGAGEGLVAFRAIDRIGPSLRVIHTDLSAPMLRYAESAALQRNVGPQCTFLECRADNLKGIADASVDVVATRAVLAYVADKKAALGEFLRILKPGGRLSIAEPILQDDAFYARALRRRVEDQSQPVDRFLTLLPAPPVRGGRMRPRACGDGGQDATSFGARAWTETRTASDSSMTRVL